MPKLVPVKLDDNTIIFIESREEAIAPSVAPPESSEEEETPVYRGGRFSADDVQDQVVQNFQAIEGTIRGYTTYTLNAFRNLAIANIDTVTLKFGIEIGGEAGIPYVTKGTAKSNLNIEVVCSFPQQLENQSK
jgi:hypothetical protein